MHILCVMDSFSRKLWTRALKGATSRVTTDALKHILKGSGKMPLELNTDAGTEFTGPVFHKMIAERHAQTQTKTRTTYPP